MNTMQSRKCRDCGYWINHAEFGWCHWLGKQRSGKSDECEDGFKIKERKGGRK